MTVSANDRRKQSAASAGQTAFPYDFQIGASSDLVVTHKVDATGVVTTLTETTHYTVNNVGSSSGTIDLVTGAALDDIITCEAQTPVARASDFDTGGDFFAATVNTAEDLQYFLLQELTRDVGRSMILPPSALDTVSTVLPIPVAEQIIGWDATGIALVNYATDDFTGPQGPQGDPGDMSGPGSSTDGDIPRFDGVTGALLQSSGWNFSDADLLTAAGELAGADNILSRFNFKDVAMVTYPEDGSGAVEFDLQNGNVQPLTISAASAWTFTGWAASDEYQSLFVPVTNGSAFTITFTGVDVWLTNSRGAPDNLQASGLDGLLFFTFDGGTTVYGAHIA